MIKAKTERPAGIRVPALSLLLAVLLAVGLVFVGGRPTHAATLFTVTNPNDSGAGSLRQAIIDANNTPGADQIRFDLPGVIPGIGVKTIRPSSPLPAIREQVIIDGYSQPGSSPNTLTQGTNANLLVQLDGVDAGKNADGLQIIGTDASNSVVRGLVINRFSSNGIEVGIAVNVRIEGNFIGSDPSGRVDRGNFSDGVAVDSSSFHTIGGTSLAARNLISGNGDDGVEISFSASRNAVLGNLIGVGRDGAGQLGNSGSGVEIGPGTQNVVGDNSSEGSNTIAFNSQNGVRILTRSTNRLSATANAVRLNSIFSNGGLGVDLEGDGRTANDAGDADLGANRLQNFPVLTSARTGGGKTTVVGTLKSVPNQAFAIRFFSNPSGNEGKTFVHQTSVKSGPDGNVSFNFDLAKAVPVGQTITATVTTPNGDTSEFSGPRTVVAR